MGSVVGVVAIEIGRFAVLIFSLGRWRGETRCGDEGRVHGAAGALSFVRDGRRVITETGLLFAGTAFLVAAVATATVIAFHT